MSDSEPFVCEAKINGLRYKPAGDQMFNLMTSRVRRNLSDHFGTNMAFITEDYLISHGRKADGTYYLDIYFKSRIQAILYRLKY